MKNIPPTEDMHRICASAAVSEPTARKYFIGAPMRKATEDRVRKALDELKLAYRRPRKLVETSVTPRARKTVKKAAKSAK
jgi:hypothetical protein